MGAVDSSSLRGRTLRSFIWKLMERGGAQAASLIVQIVLARLLTPADFGMLAVIVVFVNIANVLVQSGLNMALVQAREVDDDDFSTVFRCTAAFAMALYLLLFCAAPAIEGFYGLAGLAACLRVLGVLLFINALNSIQVAYASRSMRYDLLFRSTLIAAVLSGAGGIALACLGFGVWALVAQQVLNQLISCTVLFTLVPWKPRWVFNADRARALFGFGWKICVSNLVNTAYNNLYDLVVGKAFSAGTLGYFNQGKKYPMALEALFDEALQSVMLSATSRLQEDVQRVKRAVRLSLRVETYVVAPLMMFVAAAAPAIVPLLLTDTWTAAIPFMQIFCFMYLFAPISACNLQALYAVGRSDVVLRMEFVKKALGCCILLLTVSLGDAHLVAAGAALYSLLVTVINARPNARLLGYTFREQVRDIAPSLALALFCAAPTWALSLPGFPSGLTLLAQMLVYGALYLAGTFVFHLDAPQEILAALRRR